MENFPKPATEYNPDDEKVENPMAGMHVEDVAGVDAPESAPIPEAPAGVSEYGVATGVNQEIEGQADAWLRGKGQDVEQVAALPGDKAREEGTAEAPAGTA